MKKYNFIYAILLIMTIGISLTSCQAIGSIFKAGVWVGVIGIVILVLIIFWLIGKARNK